MTPVDIVQYRTKNVNVYLPKEQHEFWGKSPQIPAKIQSETLYNTVQDPQYTNPPSPEKNHGSNFCECRLET